VWLLERAISRPQGLCLHRTTQRRVARTHVRALSGIQTHDPSARGHCYRYVTTPSHNYSELSLHFRFGQWRQVPLLTWILARCSGLTCGQQLCTLRAGHNVARGSLCVLRHLPSTFLRDNLPTWPARWLRRSPVWTRSGLNGNTLCDRPYRLCELRLSWIQTIQCRQRNLNGQGLITHIH
jgi:hypothetical protein